MTKVPVLDQATLKAMLHYDPETGIFTWLVRADARPQWNGRYAGKVAGCVHEGRAGEMYLVIGIGGRIFYAHRLAWLYMTGEWPKATVDHHDTDGINNRWANLREASHSQNSANATRSRANTSGFKGVYLDKRRGRFAARIGVEGRTISLGYHDTAEAAHAAYALAATEQRGEFARVA